MFVIGVAGQAQMGKDTLADRLKEKLNEAGGRWERAAFAANVKKVFTDTFDRDLDFIEKWKVLPDPPPGFDMTVRQSLQFIGDGFRKIVPTIWLDLAFRNKAVPKIISDVRYVNEFLRVKQEGGLCILVGRPDKLNDDPNGSEAQIKPYVEWALKTFDPDKKFVSLEPFQKAVRLADPYYKPMPSDTPPHMEAFDVFVRNDGTKEEFYQIIDEQLVPFVQQFVFEFPEDEETQEKEEDTPCLISS